MRQESNNEGQQEKSRSNKEAGLYKNGKELDKGSMSIDNADEHDQHHYGKKIIMAQKLNQRKRSLKTEPHKAKYRALVRALRNIDDGMLRNSDTNK